MISWIENSDFEVDEKKQNFGTCREKTSDPRSYEGAILFLSFRITPEGQLMKGTSWWGFPKLLLEV